MFKQTLIRVALGAVALCPLQLLAAGSATVKHGDSVSKMSWQDGGAARFDAGTDGYMLLQGGKVYMVSPQAAGDMPQVMEVGGMMQGFAQAARAGQGPAADAGRIESVKATGRRETVAGIAGQVYTFTITDADGQTRTTEAVLTDDPLVAEMTAAYMRLTGGMVGADAAREFKDHMPAGQRGLLRMGDDMVVQAISSQAPAADAFKLPAKPVDMGSMMQEIMKNMPRQK